MRSGPLVRMSESSSSCGERRLWPRRWATSAGWHGSSPRWGIASGCWATLMMSSRPINGPIATSQGDFALEAAANFALGLAYHDLGAYRRATELLNRNVASLQGERMYGRFGTAGVTSVLSIMALAWCHAELGSFAEGIARGEEALRIAQARDDKLSLMFADLAVGQLYLRQGDLVRAVPRLERGLATCRTWDFPSWLPWLASRVGAAYTLSGRAAEALPLLEQSAEQAAAMGWKADAVPLAAKLSEAYLGVG